MGSKTSVYSIFFYDIMRSMRNSTRLEAKMTPSWHEPSACTLKAGTRIS